MKRLRQLHVQVLIGLLAAIVLGTLKPDWAIAMKPLGTAFIALLKMMLAPIIFCTLVQGMAHVKDLKTLGRMGVKSLVYFEVVSTLAMIVGFVMVNVFAPGAGLHATNIAESADAVKSTADAGHISAVSYLLSLIPHTLVDAFAKGDIVQVLIISILAGLALNVSVGADSVLLRGIDEAQTVLFRMLAFIMRLAPLGAFGAMTAAIGSYGGGTLLYLAKVIVVYYAACAIFVFGVLGAISWTIGLSFIGVLRLIRDEILLTFGTASSEVVFPRLVEKLKRAGCDELVVGFVLPAGYSFNLDGTAIYMAIAIGFIAQATDTPFSLMQQLGLLAVLSLTSKGGTTVAGGAFVKLAATLQSMRTLPIGGLGLLFGIDRIMATANALTNIVGNTVAVFTVARWEGLFDAAAFERETGHAPRLKQRSRQAGTSERVAGHQ
ncbi:cation:dicarboxylate symporter family transporter [Paraburkholderia bannensis]|uniref:cation:dicarboxylate symporter family transporter n=1 Tax=Paraburkholderia bannensis TaxID=765414 RepID=UPI002AB7633D|nr:cation:dicarboxylase symporter family transporter [Paraburkholderia bannensis]